MGAVDSFATVRFIAWTLLLSASWHGAAQSINRWCCSLSTWKLGGTNVWCQRSVEKILPYRTWRRPEEVLRSFFWYSKVPTNFMSSLHGIACYSKLAQDPRSTSDQKLRPQELISTLMELPAASRCPTSMFSSKTLWIILIPPFAL